MPVNTEAGFVVQLDRYSGPLDLLLHLIRREEIDIWDIPIARIADQFLLVVHQLGLDEAAEYLEMAARLLRIKALMLLPRRGDEEAWEDPRHELVRRLRSRQVTHLETGYYQPEYLKRYGFRTDPAAGGLVLDLGSDQVFPW